jgi:hypothetical protein
MESDRKNQSRESLKEYLLSHMERFAESASEYQWPWEIRRWHELVYCLLMITACPPLSPGRARVLSFLFADLGLLDIGLLSAAGGKEPQAEKSFQTAVYLLEREGLEPATARRAMTAVAEAAAVFHTQFAGMVQRYLRGFGDQILEDAGKRFGFSQLNAAEQRLAFTYWIQNTLNMPVGVDIPAVRSLCDTFRVSSAELHETVDELGINLALLDDVLSGMDTTARPEPIE